MEKYAHGGIFVEYIKLLISYIAMKPKTKENFYIPSKHAYK
jgi:hypothetical protein